jgi:hypothetical protein
MTEINLIIHIFASAGDKRLAIQERRKISPMWNRLIQHTKKYFGVNHIFWTRGLKSDDRRSYGERELTCEG